MVGGHIRYLKKQYMPGQRPSGNFFWEEKIITAGEGWWEGIYGT